LTIYTPYCYFIGWTKFSKIYYGSRFAINKGLYKNGAHPDDLWNIYFSSSKEVKKFREQFGEPDIIKIDKTFLTKEECLEWERSVLIYFDAKNNPLFLNKSNSIKNHGGLDYKKDRYEKMAASNRGKKRSLEQIKRMSEAVRPPITEQQKEKISLALKGRERSQETKDKISKTNTGRKLSKSHIEKLGKHRIGVSPVNKGVKTGPLSDEHKEKISLGNKGKHSSLKGTTIPDERKERISKSLKGRPSPLLGTKLSEERKEKLIKRLKGRVVSEETKEKIRLSVKKSWDARRNNINQLIEKEETL